MKRLIFFFLCLLASSATLAGPGAHGPGGEHLDAPARQMQVDATPRIDTFTESFELVGRLQGGELSILIDRYETNEPVLDGKLEVELNGLKATALFQADHGSYVVNDPAFLKALSTPGKHALVFTLTTANESDLLDGALEVLAANQVQAHSHFPWGWAGAGLLGVIVLFAAVSRFRSATTSTGK